MINENDGMVYYFIAGALVMYSLILRRPHVLDCGRLRMLNYFSRTVAHVSWTRVTKCGLQ